jgi:hypothetical protein
MKVLTDFAGQNWLITPADLAVTTERQTRRSVVTVPNPGETVRVARAADRLAIRLK